MSRRQVGFRQSRRAPGGGIPLSVTPSLGDTAAGTWLTLTGTGFSGSPTVTIGGTACTSVTVVSSTQIDCVAPAKAAGTYDVAVGNAVLSSAYEAWSPAEISGARVYDVESGVTQSSNAISQWNDRGAGAKNLSQSTAGAKPTYVANSIGYRDHAHTISFDGGDYLQAAAKEAFSSGKSAFFVAKQNNAAGRFTIYNVGNPVIGDKQASTYGNGPGFTDGKLSCVNYIEAAGPYTLYDLASTNYADGNPRLYGMIHTTGGTLRGYVNGSAIGADQTSAINTSYYGWDTIGNGFDGTDFLKGCNLAAAVVYNGALDATQRSKLYSWAYARYLRGSTSVTLQTSSAAINTIANKDGVGVVSLNNKLFAIGGWAASAAWESGAAVTTNEVYESSDNGATWTQTLAHSASPPTSGAGARFRRRHTFGMTTHTYGGTEYVYIMGGDPYDLDSGNYWQDVWRSSDGSTWERMTANGGWGARVLHMAWSFNGKLYLAGGQTDIADPATAKNDIWESSDGGATWTQTTAAADWPARGMVYHPVIHDNKVWIIGGGKYHATPASRTYYNDVWSWDGTTWTEVVADGAAPWSRRQYLALGTYDGYIWLASGYKTPGANVADLWRSKDGANWYQQLQVPWAATHAASLHETPDGSGLVYLGGIDTAANVYKVSVL